MHPIVNFVPNAITSRVGRALLKGRKNSPAILFVGGIAGFVATTVLASKATLKLEEVLDQTNETLASAKKLVESNTRSYTEEDYRKDLLYIYARAAVKVTKLYGPTILVGAASVGALTGAHVVLNKRNAGLTAAYAALELGFAEYRKRVVDEFGEDADTAFRYELEKRPAIDQKTGKEVFVYRASPNNHSVYARFFDEFSSAWSPEPEYNMIFLRCQQNYANDLLRSRGHVFLNEVYDLLKIERSGAGAVVGWVVSKEGDNYIDFGIFNGDNPRARDFVNGREGSILLDFNVDGVIYDKI